MGETNPPAVPRQGRAIAGAIAREPPSPPDYAVSKGRTPKKPPDGGFCQCGERVRLPQSLRRRGAPFKSSLNLRGVLAPRFPVACFRSP